MFFLGIGIIALVFGVKFIFDARPIAKKYFSYSNKNEATKGLKILGLVFMIIGTIIFYFCF